VCTGILHCLCICIFNCFRCLLCLLYHVIVYGLISFSTLIGLLLGPLTCKNRLPYNLYCVGGYVKNCTIQYNTAAVGRDSGLHRTAVGLLYPRKRKRRTLWTSDFNVVTVRLRTSCYWVLVQSYVYVSLFTVWFLSNAKTNFPETLHYSLQYMRVCVHKIMFDSVNFIACY